MNRTPIHDQVRDELALRARALELAHLNAACRPRVATPAWLVLVAVGLALLATVLVLAGAS